MSQKQASQDSSEEDLWASEDSLEYGDASNDPEIPIKERMAMRHKIEDLLESRRLQAQLSEYESFDIGGDGRRRHHQ